MFRLLYSLLRINPREVEFPRRGFNCSRPEVRWRLEEAGRSFLHGYHAALNDDQETLAPQLNAVAVENQGFAYEGAAMALVLLDGISPWKAVKRFPRFVAGAGRQHVYMVHVGAGWAFARLPWLRRNIESVIRKLHPVLRWLAIDGYGFHEGYFHWRSTLQLKISALSENARHVFYQGLGRSLWFIHGADPGAIRQTISRFAPQYHGDAWSGVGLACTYAGGTGRSELEILLRHADSHRTAIAQGAAFAVKARLFAGNPVPHTELACRTLCDMGTEAAAALCDETLYDVDSYHPCPYQQWRELMHHRLTALPTIDLQTAPVFQLPETPATTTRHKKKETVYARFSSNGKTYRSNT